MAVVDEVGQIKVVMKLNIGTTPSGAPKTASVSLGNINKTAYVQNNGDEKAVAIANAFRQIMAHTLNAITKTITSELYEE